MAISKNIDYASLDELKIDPYNPRLGKNITSQELDQEKLLELMKDFTLEELAQSFIENKGFWVQEAVIVVEEKLYSKSPVKVVVEGNRRIAALKLLERVVNKTNGVGKKFQSIVENVSVSKNLFEKIPYLLAGSRADIDSFLGFRHVTGIKEWDPEEKAEFIAKMIDSGLSYDEVRKKIGSKAPTVRNHYFAHKLVKQLEENFEDFDYDNISNRCSVLYLAIQKPGVQEYLNLDLDKGLTKSRPPIDSKHLSRLRNFGKWIFGDEKNPPLFSDSRDTTKFSEILQNKEAVRYLETSKEPKWEQAIIIAGVDVNELIDLIRNASWNVQYVLSKAHRFKDNKQLKNVAEDLQKDTAQLNKILSSN